MQLFFTTKEITPAQLKNLRTVPVDLIAAPGPGLGLWIVFCHAKYKFGTLPYTGGNADSLEIIIKDGYDEQVRINHTFMISGTEDLTIAFPGSSETMGAARMSQIVNKPLQLISYGQDDLTGGDGSLFLTLAYLVVDLS